MDFKHLDGQNTEITGSLTDFNNLDAAVSVSRDMATILNGFGVVCKPSASQLGELADKVRQAIYGCAANETVRVSLDNDEVRHSCGSLVTASLVAGMGQELLIDPSPDMSSAACVGDVEAALGEREMAYDKLREQLTPAIRQE